MRRNRLDAIVYGRNYSNIISGIVRTSTDLGRVSIAIQGTVFIRELGKEFEAGICAIVMHDAPSLVFRRVLHSSQVLERPLIQVAYLFPNSWITGTPDDSADIILLGGRSFP